MDYISKEDYQKQAKRLIILLNETKDEKVRLNAEKELKRLNKLRFESKLVDRFQEMEDRKRR